MITVKTIKYVLQENFHLEGFNCLVIWDLKDYRVLGTRAFGDTGVGLSLDSDERKRLLVRGSSFALKKREIRASPLPQG